MSTIALAAHRSIAAKLLHWKHGDQHQLTVIAKITGRFVNNGEVEIIDPKPLERRDRFVSGDPTRDLERTSEVHPHLPRCDVLLSGSAHAPPDARTDASGLRTFTSRLLLIQGDHPVVDKSILARLYPSEARAPLSYTKALGGTSAPDNPIGTPSPVFVDPFDPQRSVGFGPIPKFWPARKRLIADKPMPSSAGRDAGGALEVHPQFPFELLQAAPRDQQIVHLRGGEWLVLFNLSARGPEISTCLPLARVEARVWLGGTKIDLQLATDMLLINAEDETIEIVARRHVTLGDSLPADIRVAVTLIDPRLPADWVSLDLATEPLVDPVPPSVPVTETVTLAGPLPSPAAPPFQSAAPSPSLISAPAPPPSHSKKNLSETVTSDDDKPPSLRAPFPLQQPGAPPPRPSSPSATPWGSPLPRIDSAMDETGPLTRTKPLSLQNILANLPQAPSTLPKAAPPRVAPPAPPPVAPPPPGMAPRGSPPSGSFSPGIPAVSPTPYRAPHTMTPHRGAPGARPGSPPRAAAPSAANPQEDPLIARLRASGASEADIAALIARLAPAPPPPADD